MDSAAAGSGRPLRALTVFGTRPEAIKMAPLVRALEAAPGFDSRVCVTAQHRTMLDHVLELFELTPHHDLDLMRDRQTLPHLTAAALTGLSEVLESERPDIVLVQGDTTTTLAGALAAFYAGIPCGHVEAGLRTGDLAAPFPEEANRLLTDRLASFYFVPTSRCRDALLAEGLPAERIWQTGNTVVDALLWIRDRLRQVPLEQDRKVFGSAYPAIARGDDPIVLITGHRRESFGTGFRNICRALHTLATKHPAVHWVYPVHLNPQVQEPVRRHLSNLPNVHLLEPLTYAPFVRLMDRCTFLLTDSGGVQEEAPGLGKPVLVMREVTERQEGVDAGTARLVGTDPDRIVREAKRLLRDPEAYTAMSQAHNPYGDGRAAERIVEALAEALGRSPS
ncbi:MAG: UDP-N-acetylglucosamine 2-epimerase (non-hydrolyzing) [Acidobacteriota bacterium]